MDLRNTLNRYYYDTTVSDLRMFSRVGQGDLSYNSVMYLDVIAYQAAQEGGCTVSTLAKTLHITNSAATIKVNELVKKGFVRKMQGEADRRFTYLSLTDSVAAALKAYDSPFERAVGQVEKQFAPEELEIFCAILKAFTDAYTGEDENEPATPTI